MQINGQIKKYRKAADLTQEQVANYLGVSTPAVNKWEKGSTFPDITLLPALARLLKIDLDTLFSFREALTDIEIEAFIRELAMTAQSNLDNAFDMAVQKIQEYPKCDSLVLSSANILNACLVMAPTEPEEKKKYEDLVIQWLEQAAESSNMEVKNAAIYILLGRMMREENYEKASSLLDQLPKQQIDKTPYEANILAHQEKLDEAAVLLESKLLQSLSNIQTYCLKLIELEMKCNQSDKARQIAEILEKMVSLFGLWQYGAIVPRLQISLYEKDAQQSMENLKKALEAANTPWITSDSPLLYRIAHDSVQNVGRSFIPKLITELKTSAEYDFIRDDLAFQEFLTELN